MKWYNYEPRDDGIVNFPIPKKSFESLMEYQKKLWAEDSHISRLRKTLMRSYTTCAFQTMQAHGNDWSVYLDLYPMFLQYENYCFIIDYYSANNWDTLTTLIGIKDYTKIDDSKRHFNYATGGNPTRSTIFQIFHDAGKKIFTGSESELVGNFIYVKSIGIYDLYKNDYVYRFIPEAYDDTVGTANAYIYWFHLEGIIKLLTENQRRVLTSMARKCDFYEIQPAIIDRFFKDEDKDEEEPEITNEDLQPFVEAKLFDPIIFAPDFKIQCGIKDVFINHLFVAVPQRLKAENELTSRLWDAYPETFSRYIVLSYDQGINMQFFVYSTYGRAQYQDRKTWQTKKPLYSVDGKTWEEWCIYESSNRHHKINFEEIYWFKLGTSLHHLQSSSGEGFGYQMWYNWDQLERSKKLEHMGMQGAHIPISFESILAMVFLRSGSSGNMDPTNFNPYAFYY